MINPKKSTQLESALINLEKVRAELNKLPPGTVVKKSHLRIKFAIPHSQAYLVWDFIANDPNYYVRPGEIEIIKAPGPHIPS